MSMSARPAPATRARSGSNVDRKQAQPARRVSFRGAFPSSQQIRGGFALPAAADKRVWVLASPRAGERTQLLALAEALGCPFEVKRIVRRRFGAVAGLVGADSLAGVDRQASDALEAPWPDIVLLAHESNENVACWIRRQSGGRTRLVLVGRPWSSASRFDLVVTTPQYGLPERPNILHNHLPLHRVSADRLAAAGTRWRRRLAGLPRPFVTVLVGGSSGPYVFDQVAAARLGREASALARELGGSVLATTSARTPPAAAEALFAAIDAPAFVHRWAPGDHDNPYFGLLALADRIVVTGDSISMIAEACATGKPVQLFDFGVGPLAMRGESAPGPVPPESGSDRAGHRLRAALYALYMRLPRWRLNRTRDLRVVHRALLATGRVGWFGEPLPAAGVRLAGDETTRTANRVHGLVDGSLRRARQTGAALSANLRDLVSASA
jgi:uncharacterized protein